MAQNILEVHNLVKTYQNYTAVKGVSFVVPKGKIIGLLGPNGAGKTTTIQMLLGVTLYDAGDIRYFGKSLNEHRQYILQRINFTSAFNTLQGRISAYENLLVFAQLYSVNQAEKKIKDLAEYFEITDQLSKKYGDLSAGQKSRVNLVKSMLNDPELILMDEPTASLDPDIADKTLSLIEKRNRETGMSILYTSHEMDEVTRICDEVIFMDHGKIVAHDTPLGLTKRIKEAKLVLTFDATKKTMEDFLTENNHKHEFINKNTVEITVNEKDIPKVIFKVSNTGIWITDIEVHKPTLEDFFLQIARGGEEHVV